MDSDRLISADSHVAISLDVIRERVPKALHEDFDQAIAQQAESDNELRGGKKLSLADWDMEAFKDPGYRDPVARLAAMDRDGVQAEVLYSEVSAFRAFGLLRGDWKPISRAFTDHLSDFAAHDPKRLVVSYQVPIIDIDYAVEEVLRLAAMGARSVHLPNFPSELGLPDYHEELYDPLWAVLQETGISISHHLGNRNWLYDVYRRDPTPQIAIFTSLPALALSEVVAWWILTGTLERFPGLKIVFVEPSLYWIPGFIAQLDRKVEGPYNLPNLKLRPSEYFHRNIACTFMDDEIGLQQRHLVGIENILWSTDFPHPATTWPNSRAVVDRQFADIPNDERELICAGNAERIYGLQTSFPVTGDTNAIYWDPYSVELNDNPHGIRLRDEVPVYRNDDLDFWALSRFTDVDAASWDTTTFSSAHGTVLERMRTEPRGGGMMIFLDPPEHTRLSRQGPRSSS